uniref:Uncharacterized protein n=1 Tax=Caenorhabditis japonica TaxID=281687 RepID=A0A8R1IZI9_CAEJA
MSDAADIESETSQSSSKSSDQIPPFSEIELSGLGGKGLRSKDVQERYKAIRDAANTRSILSVGICTMKLIRKSEKRRALRYETQVFNLLTFSEHPFTVEPSALQFLAKHSFDFNRLISDGIRFQGNNCPLKTLLRELLRFDF